MADPADEEPANPPLPAVEDGVESLVERVKELAEDTQTAIEAELAWQRARAGFVGGRVTGIAAWAGLALVCLFIALLALAFGTILALTPAFGAVLATAMVTAALLLVSGIAGLVVRGRVNSLKSAAFAAKPGALP